MANADYVFRTSYFKVIDEKRYKELTRGFAESICQFDKDLDGQLWHGFGDYESFNYYLPASECPVVTDALAEGMKIFDCNGEPVSAERIDDEDTLYDEHHELFWVRNEDAEYCGEGFDWFINQLQKILTTDSAFVCIEAGHEKLRYVDAFVIIVTTEAVCSMSLDEYIGKTLEDLLGVGVNVSWQY